MRRWAVVLSAVTISLGAATTVASTAANAGNDNDPYTVSNGHVQGGAAGGFVPAQGSSNAARPGGGGAVKNLIYHNGPVQHTTVVEPIFVGPDWGADSQKFTTGDKITGLETLYDGLANTNTYGSTNSEYADLTKQKVNPLLTYAKDTATFDTSTNFTSDPGTTALGQEVVNALGTAPVAGGYYPVYIEGKRGSAGYCAYHDTTTYTDSSNNTVEFQVGFFFNLDGDSGCDPHSPSTLQHSQGLAALANVTGHEYSEMLTDPQLNAWWDQQGNENADKCAWTFGANPLNINGTSWKIQGNWSNAAALAGRGYIFGRSRVVGCIDGTNNN